MKRLVLLALLILVFGCSVLTEVSVRNGLYGDDCHARGQVIVCMEPSE